jgi:hypothetical protein
MRSGAGRFGEEIEESLQGIREVLAVIQGSCGQNSCLSKIPSGFEGKMIEVTPSTIGREHHLGVIREVELQNKLSTFTF